MKEFFLIALIVVLAVLLIVFGPLAIIWALNTLFPVLSIPYNFWSWLAMVVLNLTWFSKSKLEKK